MIKIPIFSQPPPVPEVLPPPPAPKEPKFPAAVIDKAQRIYSSKYNNTGPDGKSAAVQPVPPTAIPAAGRWGSDK